MGEKNAVMITFDGCLWGPRAGKGKTPVRQMTVAAVRMQGKLPLRENLRLQWLSGRVSSSYYNLLSVTVFFFFFFVLILSWAWSALRNRCSHFRIFIARCECGAAAFLARFGPFWLRVAVWARVRFRFRGWVGSTLVRLSPQELLPLALKIMQYVNSLPSPMTRATIFHCRTASK